MGTTAAALWDVLAKAANLAQMSGLHVAMLVAVGATLLRIPQSYRECVELERCARRLLEWPVPGRGVTMLLCSPEMGGPVSKVLGDATGLVNSYKKNTLWCRVRTGRSMARELRDMQDVVNSYCALVLFINANMLILQATTQQASETTTIHEDEVNDPPESPGVQALTNFPTDTDTGSRDTQKAREG